MKKTKKHINRPPEPHWQELVQVWFDFTRAKFSGPPSFDGSSPRDLRNIIIQLRKRCETKGIVWDETEAKKRLYLFLKAAYDVEWLRSHWTLFNINRQKDIIFLNAANNALYNTQYNNA